MARTNSPDPTLVPTAAAHLRILAGIALHDVPEADLRAASGSLRLLVADSLLARAWRAAGFGGPMTFKAWCIDSSDGPGTVAFCGGGDVLPGMPFSACVGATLKEKRLDFEALRQATRLQVGAMRVTTSEVIQYVANALGGSHYDPDGRAARRGKADLLRRVEAGDIAAVPIRVNDRSLLHHEVLSIMQVVLRSPEVTRLRLATAGPG